MITTYHNIMLSVRHAIESHLIHKELCVSPQGRDNAQYQAAITAHLANGKKHIQIRHAANSHQLGKIKDKYSSLTINLHEDKDGGIIYPDYTYYVPYDDNETTKYIRYRLPQIPSTVTVEIRLWAINEMAKLEYIQEIITGIPEEAVYYGIESINDATGEVTYDECNWRLFHGSWTMVGWKDGRSEAVLRVEVPDVWIAKPQEIERGVVLIDETKFVVEDSSGSELLKVIRNS